MAKGGGGGPIAEEKGEAGRNYRLRRGRIDDHPAESPIPFSAEQPRAYNDGLGWCSLG